MMTYSYEASKTLPVSKGNKRSFFPQTIKDWNDLSDSQISSAKVSDVRV